MKNEWLNSALLPSLDHILPIHIVASARPEEVVRNYLQQQQHHSWLQASLFPPPHSGLGARLLPPRPPGGGPGSQGWSLEW